MRSHSLDQNLFNDLDLKLFLERSLTLCLEKTGAGLVVWIDKDEFDKINHHKNEEKFEEGQSFSRDLKVCATSEIKTEGLIHKLKTFDMDQPSPQVKNSEILFPINSYDGKDILGYWLVTGIPEGKSSRAALGLSKLSSQISKHLGFCLKHQAALNESFVDDLTGLYNQRYMAMTIENEIFRCTREKKKFSVLFMDIDHFKAVNDNDGHWIGSRLLIELGHVIQANTRRSDYCFRYGGDEFVIMLSGSDQDGATVAAERLRKIIEETDFLVDGNQYNITMSIGIATYPDHAESHKEIIQMADKAMYCGKNKSRNIIVMAS